MTLMELSTVETHPVPTPTDGTEYPDSQYLRYLPGILQQDAFLRRVLLIFETVLVPLERVVDTLPLYTEPEIAPSEFLPWLARWVGVTLDSAWPVDRQRAMIAHAVEIYRWRGTRRGLALHLQAYIGQMPVIQEYRGGFVLGRHSGLGWTTRLGNVPPDPLMFAVTVPVADPPSVDEQVLRAIIEEDKPAHTTYSLNVVAAPGGAQHSKGKADD